MKAVSVLDKDGNPTNRSVQTPWLRIEEAAAYCGLSRTTFDVFKNTLPHSGNNRTRLYHTEILDAWIKNELETPFLTKPKKNNPRPRRRPRRHGTTAGTIINPKNGRIF